MKTIIMVGTAGSGKSLLASKIFDYYTRNGALIGTPTNFVSIAMLASSVKLRLGLPQINILTKMDLIEDKIKDVLKWSTNMATLEEAIAKQVDGESYTLAINLLRSLNIGGFSQGLIPVSNTTGNGMANLQAALSRILNRGEEVED